MPQVSGRVIGWVLGGIVLLVATVLLYATNSLPSLGGLDPNLLIAIGILLALAASGIMKKGGIAGTVALVVVVVGLLLFGTDAPKVWKKVQSGASSVVLSESKNTTDEDFLPKQPQGLPEGRNWVSMVMVWDEVNPDGSIPMHTPSPTLKLGPGCTVAYSGQNGVDYVVLHQIIGGGWDTHKPGQHDIGNDVKFMVIRKGVKQVDYWYSCP